MIRWGWRAAASAATAPPRLSPNRATREASTSGQAQAAVRTASRSASSVRADIAVVSPWLALPPPPRKSKQTATAPAAAKRLAMGATRVWEPSMPWQQMTRGAGADDAVRGM